MKRIIIVAMILSANIFPIEIPAGDFAQNTKSGIDFLSLGWNTLSDKQSYQNGAKSE